MKEYILSSFLEKYKEICRYSTTRINTLNHTDEEIQVSVKSDQLMKLYSSKIKNFIEIFKNEEKYTNVIYLEFINLCYRISMMLTSLKEIKENSSQKK